MNQISPPVAFPAPITRQQLPPGLWSSKHTFRHGQCDPAGIVYTPEFFNVFNQVIEAWFCECLALSYYDILGRRRTGLGYVNAHADFFAPVKMGEEIEIFLRVVKIGRTSYALELNGMIGDTEAQRGRFTTVTTDLETHKSVEIPRDIRDALTHYGIAGAS